MMRHARLDRHDRRKVARGGGRRVMQCRGPRAVPEQRDARGVHVEMHRPFATCGGGQEGGRLKDHRGMVAVVFLDNARIQQPHLPGIAAHGPGMAAVRPEIKPRGRGDIDGRGGRVALCIEDMDPCGLGIGHDQPVAQVVRLRDGRRGERECCGESQDMFHVSVLRQRPGGARRGRDRAGRGAHPVRARGVRVEGTHRAAPSAAASRCRRR